MPFMVSKKLSAFGLLKLFFEFLFLLFSFTWSIDKLNATMGRLNATFVLVLHLVCRVAFSLYQKTSFFGK